MSENKEQVMSETKISFDGEKVVTSVSNGSSNTTVTTTGDSVVISVTKEKTPQDPRDQEEYVEMSVPKAKGSFNKLSELGIDLSVLL